MVSGEQVDTVQLHIIQGGSNMTGTDLYVNLATSVLVIFEPPCIMCKLVKSESKIVCVWICHCVFCC